MLRALMGIPVRLDFRVAVGLVAFAGWAAGPAADEPVYGVAFPFPGAAYACVVTHPNPQGGFQRWHLISEATYGVSE